MDYGDQDDIPLGTRLTLTKEQHQAPAKAASPAVGKNSPASKPASKGQRGKGSTQQPSLGVSKPRARAPRKRQPKGAALAAKQAAAPTTTAAPVAGSSDQVPTASQPTAPVAAPAAAPTIALAPGPPAVAPQVSAKAVTPAAIPNSGASASTVSDADQRFTSIESQIEALSKLVKAAIPAAPAPGAA